MMLILSSLLTLQTNAVDRYELGERLRKTEASWMVNRSRDVKRRTTDEISAAVFSFFSQNGSKAAQSLDSAVARLEGRPVRTSDAINIRFSEPFSEPGQPLKLQISWSYRPQTVVPVKVSCAGKSVDVSPGKNAVLNVNPYDTMPELKLNPEVGTLVPVRVGNETRLLYVSYVRNFKTRLGALLASPIEMVRNTATFLKDVDDSPGKLEADLPLIQLLFQAELLEEGKLKIPDLEQILHAKKNETIFRAQFPRGLRGRTSREVNVVIALHGMGGSENMFFEAYGRGSAVTETMKRGWVFISPRAGSRAINDVLAWLKEDRSLRVGNLYLLGHSAGANLVLGSEPTDTPRALAVFAPAGAKRSVATKDSPLFVAVGKQEIPALKTMSASLAKDHGGRKDFQFREYDPAEHLMIVTEAVDDAFRFFDKYAK